jgi:hypothetical protein
VFGFKEMWKAEEKRRTALFLGIWIVVQFLLLYAPVSFQRRLIFGVQFPLALLAAVGILKVLRKPALVGALICLMSVTNFSIMSKEIQWLKSRGLPFYLPKAYMTAFKFLHGLPDGPVISGFTTGNFIPPYSGHPAFMGHALLTPSLAEKRKTAELFFKKADPAIPLRYNVRYVFYGAEERALDGRSFKLPMKEIYQQDGLRIYDLAALSK